MRVVLLPCLAFLLVALGCSGGDSVDDKLDRHDTLTDECTEEALDAQREAQAILDVFNVEHGGEEDYLKDYFALRDRLMRPIDDEFERCLDEAKEKAGLD